MSSFIVSLFLLSVLRPPSLLQPRFPSLSFRPPQRTRPRQLRASPSVPIYWRFDRMNSQIIVKSIIEDAKPIQAVQSWDLEPKRRNYHMFNNWDISNSLLTGNSYNHSLQYDSVQKRLTNSGSNFFQLISSLYPPPPSLDFRTRL